MKWISEKLFKFLIFLPQFMIWKFFEIINIFADKETLERKCDCWYQYLYYYRYNLYWQIFCKLGYIFTESWKVSSCPAVYDVWDEEEIMIT